MPELDEVKVIVKRVTDYGPKPRGPKQALIQAHAFLAEEGQWITGEFFEDGDPQEAYEAASCSSWSACAMGALGLVTGEMPIAVHRKWTEAEVEDVRDDWIDCVYRYQTDLGLVEWVNTTDEGRRAIQDAQTNADDEAEYEFMFKDVYNEKATPVSFASARHLAKFIDLESFDNSVDEVIRYGDRTLKPVETVIQFNDSVGEGRTAVLDTFEKAIRSLGGEPLVDHRAKPKRKPKAKK